MRFRLVFALAAGLVIASGRPGKADFFVIWDDPNPGSPAAATGTITTPGGVVAVTLTTSIPGPIGAGNDTILTPDDSSTFGTFFGGRTTADVYGPGLPGTDDFIVMVNGTDASVLTLTFSQPVTDPTFYVNGVDFRLYNFAGGLTPVVLPGSLNLVATGNVVGDSDPASFDNGGADPNKGNPDGSAYGRFQLGGTFTAISWSRPLGPGGFVTDGNQLGISVAAVPEPSSLGLLGIGTAGLLGVLCRRRQAKGCT